MKKEYLTPFIQSSDLVNFHFARNQATCDTGILNNEDLVGSLVIGAGCGIGFGTQVQFCLSGLVPNNQVEGLTVVLSGGISFEILACGPSAFTCQPGDASYTCQISGNLPQTVCVVSLECEDGTILTTCQVPCFGGIPGDFVTNS